jgi:hypothetical protein
VAPGLIVYERLLDAFQGRINLLDVLICGLEGKDEDHYIKTFEKWLK